MTPENTITIITTDAKLIEKLVARRHPEYDRQSAHWAFCMATYESSREWFKENIHRFVREGDDTHKGRLERAYRFNHTREVVDLTTKYLFKGDKVHRGENVPDAVKQFRDQATLNGRPLSEHMRHGARLASVFGRVYAVVDSKVREKVLNRAEEKRLGSAVYSYFVDPISALDFAYDEAQQYEWFLVRETTREDDDPFTSSGNTVERFRLWGKKEWALYGMVDKRWGLIDFGQHELGVVPIIPLDDTPSGEKYAVPALIGDVAYLDRAVANYLSNLDQIINDQTFSQLVMPAQANLWSAASQGIMNDDGSISEEKYKKNVLKLGTAQVLVYDGEQGDAPHYISPDPKQAEIITGVIKQIVNEIYHSVGLAGERTKQDNSMGIDNSSGVAKAFDFERVSSLLQSKAAALQCAERRMQEIVLAYHGKLDEAGRYDDQIVYPSTFDVRGMGEELALAADLSALEVPVEIRREQLLLLVEKIFPLINAELQAKIEKAIEAWDPQLQMTQSGAFGETVNRQGEVTPETGSEK